MKTYHRCLYWVAAGFILMASFNVAAFGSPIEDDTDTDGCTFTTQKDGIVLDTDGNYVITYDGCIVVWEPATKIDPEVIGHMTVNGTDISYDYQIRNGGKGRQPIAGILLNSSSASFNVRFPPGWGGHAGKIHTPGRGFTVGISRWPGAYGINRLKGIQPGTALGGIGFDNTDLPGVGNVNIRGAILKADNNFPGGSPGAMRPSNWTKELYQEFNDIQSNNHVPRLAPIPVIPVTTPFDAGNVLIHIQRHVDTDLIKLNLVEPVFVEQLDRLFQVAIAAAKTNDLTAARTYIQDMYKLIEREQGDKTKAIDPLAAKVLVFDLKYIEKRIGYEQ